MGRCGLQFFYPYKIFIIEDRTIMQKEFEQLQIKYCILRGIHVLPTMIHLR